MIMLTGLEASKVVGGRKWWKSKAVQFIAPIALAFVPGVGPALSAAASAGFAIDNRRKGGVKNTVRVASRAALLNIVGGKFKKAIFA